MKINNINPVLAIDLGGTSGRAVMGRLENGKIELLEISRFTGYMKEREEHIYWDIDKIFSEIKSAIKKANEIDSTFESIAVDTWGVDFGLINSSGLIKEPYCYRDTYSEKAFKDSEATISHEELYKKTGIQPMAINSLFQLIAWGEDIKKLSAEKDIDSFLLMPDLLSFMLTGEKRAELSIASTTQMLNPYTNDWDYEIAEKFGIDKSIFPKVITPCRILGKLKPEIEKELDVYGKRVISVASHDTASAVYSIPERENSIFLSSGTWSLLGAELEEPVIDELTYKHSFSNEKGVDEKTLLLKNLTGMWLIEESKRYYAEKEQSFSYDEITKMTKSLDIAFVKNCCFFDTDRAELSERGNIPEKIQRIAKETGQNVPETPAEVFGSIYVNLAYKYRTILEQMKEVSKDIKTRDRLCIVGGGSRAETLCQHTANALGTHVYAGLAEATVMGNILAQLRTIYGLSKEEIKEISEKSAEFKLYEQSGDKEVLDAYQSGYKIYKNYLEGN